MIEHFEPNLSFCPLFPVRFFSKNTLIFLIKSDHLCFSYCRNSVGDSGTICRFTWIQHATTIGRFVIEAIFTEWMTVNDEPFWQNVLLVQLKACQMLNLLLSKKVSFNFSAIFITFLFLKEICYKIINIYWNLYKFFCVFTLNGDKWQYSTTI